MTNVISFEHAVNGVIKRTIIDNLKNRGGRWVAEPFLLTIAETSSNPNGSVMIVIKQMVDGGELEQQFVPLHDKMNRTMQAAMYRLVPQGW